MSNRDWEYINNLLGAIHQAAAAGPKFATIATEATAELDAYMKGTTEDVPEVSSEPDSPDEESTGQIRRL